MILTGDTGRSDAWTRRSAPIIFGIAFVFGLWQILFPGRFGFGGGWEAVAIARELVRSGRFANPFAAGPSGATGVIAPGFPLFLAALIKILGDTPLFAAVASLACVVAQSLHAAMLPRLGNRLFGTPRPGIVAGLLSAVSFQLLPQWDSPFTSCGLVVLLIESDLATMRATIFTGAGAGLLFLWNPSTLPITSLWILFLAIREQCSLLRTAALAATMFALILPWTLRNRLAVGTFSVKDNFGMTVYASNNDCASSSLDESRASGCYEAMHPNTSVAELAKLNALGEHRYDQLRTRETLEWIRRHGAGFSRLTLYRIRDFWFPYPAPPYLAIAVIWCTTGISAGGLILLLRRRLPVSWFLLAAALTYPLPYYVVVSDVRYRYPLLWLSFICAGYMITEPGASVSSRDKAQRQ